jgi:hypothetical protein
MYDYQSTLTGLSDERAWRKHCGFLDLTLAGFMEVQRQRLTDALPALAASALGRSLMDGQLPQSIDEFRQNVRLTDYENYIPVFDSGRAEDLPGDPVFWARTSRRNSDQANIPYTEAAFEQLIDACTAAFLLASADGDGRSRLNANDRVLYNLPPLPFLSGMLAEGLGERLNLRPVLDHKTVDTMEFHEKVALGFERALDGGVDAVTSMTSVLLKMGQAFENKCSKGGLKKALRRPKTAARLLRGVIAAKLGKRSLLPRDLWPVKALICWGTDTAVHREALKRYWGVFPYEFLATSEGGIMATQAWNRRGMTFFPGINFLEFIRDDELARERRSPNFDPATHLMDELVPGHSYEIVITSTNGMPFVRYRTGELVEVIDAKDDETGVMLPQVLPAGRSDQIIDIEGFTRLDENTLGRAIQAMAGSGVEWTARKEHEDATPVLRVYVEAPDDAEAFESKLHDSLLEHDPYFRDLQAMLEVKPMRVSALDAGSFRSFYLNRREAGYALDAQQMPRINATDNEMGELFGDRPPEVPEAMGAAA